MAYSNFARQSLLVAVAATSMLAGGYVLAANQAPSGGASSATAAQDQTADKDAGKLSMDGAQGYQDVALARLAIFDGRTADAKKFVDAADTAFNKAKTDHTAFVKAENALMPPDAQPKVGDAGKQGASAPASFQSKVTPATQSQTADVGTPKAWLPVDGEISVNEDFSANPAKAAAVADANKSLAKGDRQGAMAKLKVAAVDLDYVVAVVPLQQTLNDVHQAATMVDGGKFYEASQQLRQVQDSTRYDSLDIVGTPDGAKAKGPAKGGMMATTPMTGASKPTTNR